MWKSVLTSFYANQARLDSSNVGQPFHHEHAFVNGGSLMSEKLLWYIGTANPLQLWIIQFSVIITTAALLSFALREIRQPKVIAEVLGGIVLGPTVCGRIPGFTEHIFPPESRPYLTLTADIGLCLFFFLVGLQIEPFGVKKNLRVSAIIALAGMVFPFITGAGLSVLLYQQFVNENVQPTYFMFFTGVAFSVTAFPVMCRILTELKLLDTTVGAAVISAGVGNDIIGWILLALSVAMLKAGSSLGALYIILSCVIWTLILLFPVKSFLRMLAQTTGSIDNGPSVLFMTVGILLLFSSALVTNINGVHSIFGAFLTGLIVPREGNLATLITEKLEDMVEIIFLPFYFALLGMSTNLALLNDGITWVYTISIILAAFMSKFGSCAIAAKYSSGFSWRESGAIGSLMSCKGLVELIVLDVGLSSGVFTPRVFTMFVLEALVLTFMTTPLVVHFYPHDIRKRDVAESAMPGDVTANSQGSNLMPHFNSTPKRRFTVVLDRLEHVPAVMEFTQLFSPRRRNRPLSTTLSKSVQKRAAISIEALRLIELSDHSSLVMKSSESLLQADHLLAIIKMFGRLHGLPITPAVDIATYDDLAESVIEHARNYGSDLIVLPWLLPSVNTSYQHTSLGETSLPFAHNRPGKLAVSTVPKPSARIHAHFIQGIFEHASADVAVYLDQNVNNPIQGKSHHHLFLPFFGGPDDRFALDFVAQLCENEEISARVLRLFRKDRNEITSTIELNEDRDAGFENTESDTADDKAWKYFTSTAPSVSLEVSLSRMEFKECITTLPLHAIVHEAHAIKQLGIQLLVVAGRSNHHRTDVDLTELSDLVAEYGDLDAETTKTIGVFATAVVTANCGDGVLVLQKASCRD